jgi:hypothetical protein
VCRFGKRVEIVREPPAKCLHGVPCLEEPALGKRAYCRPHCLKKATLPFRIMVRYGYRKSPFGTAIALSSRFGYKIDYIGTGSCQ